jgi:hypothetical protein
LTPLRWFLFLAGAGGVVGLVLLVGERRPLAGSITIELPTVRRS